MARINENSLAQRVAKEVKSRIGRNYIDVPIAQVKDYLKATLDDLAVGAFEGSHRMSDVVALIERHYDKAY